jgi:hypothetical protein
MRAINRTKTADDNLQDAIEAFTFITDVLIGALIEPGRDAEQWCRRALRDALAGDTVKRISTRQIIWKAQRGESAFLWLRAYHSTFELLADNGKSPGEKYHLVDFAAPIERDF